MVGHRGGSSLGPAPGASLAADQRLERLRGYVRLLDDGIRVPGTKIRFGLDPILGLVPGLGDAVGAVLSVAIIREAARRGVPRATLLRMAFNVAMDTGLGAIPLLGDIFDALWKANRSNLELLDGSLGKDATKPANNRAIVVMLSALIVLVLASAIAIGWLGLRLLSWLAGG